MVNTEKENIVAKFTDYVLEENVELNQKNANMLESLSKLLKKNHALFKVMETHQVEENYVVHGKIIVLD